MGQTFYLCTLNMYVGNNASAWPSQATLARAMNSGRRSIQRWQQEMEAMGVIQVDVGRGCQQTNRYRMDLSSLPIPTATNSAPRAPLPEVNSAPHAPLIAHHVRLNSAPRAHRKNMKEHRKEHSPKSGGPDLQTAEFIWDLIHEMQPDRKPPNLTTWANTIRLMRERDGRTHEQIRELFRRANQDEFWCTNILSPDKLRTKWDNLTLKLIQKPINGTSSDFATVQATVLRTYSPDLRNTADVEAALTTEQYHAVKAIGLDRVINTRGDTRALAAEYAAARKA